MVSILKWVDKPSFDFPYLAWLWKIALFYQQQQPKKKKKKTLSYTKLNKGSQKIVFLWPLFFIIPNTENYLHIRFFIETNRTTFSSNNHEAYEAWCGGFLSFRKTKTCKLRISYRTCLPYYLSFSSRKIVWFLEDMRTSWVKDTQKWEETLKVIICQSPPFFLYWRAKISLSINLKTQMKSRNCQQVVHKTRGGG